MKRGHFAILTWPPCGHERILSLEDIPPDWLDDIGWTIRPEVLARMRCEKCGRRGADVDECRVNYAIPEKAAR